MKLLKKYKDEIGAGSSIVGLLIGFFGFYFTIYQIVETREALKAANAYEIQRDARSLIDEIEVDIVRRAMSGEVMEKSDGEKLNDLLWKMGNFYLSVYRQAKAGGISDSFSISFQKDFCGFIKNSYISAALDDMKGQGMIGISHVEMKKDWCP